MSSNFSYLIAGLIVGVFLFFLLSQNQTETNGEPAPTALPTSTPISPRTILSGIQDLDELITIRIDVALIELEVRDPAPLGCTYSAQHVARGVVEAGIDLAAIDEASIEKNMLGYPTKVTLPAPELSSCRIEYFRQYDRQGGGNAKCFGNNWEAMSEIGRHLAMEQILRHARDRDILAKSGRQAVNVVGGFISNLTGGNVQIESEEPSQKPVIPPSCHIDPPDDWALREDGEGWRRK